MNAKTFSIHDALSQGWSVFKKRPLFFVLIPLLPAILSSVIGWGGAIITGGISSATQQSSDNSFVSAIVAILVLSVQLVSWLASVLVSIGVQAVYLRAIVGKETKIADLFAYKHLIIPYVLASVAVGIVSLPAFLLFIIPGIIWGLATEFYTFALLTPGTGPIAAIKESMRVTKGARLKLFVFSLVLIMVNVVGVICLFIGVFVSIPVTGLALAWAYVTLKAQSDSARITETT